VTPPVVLSDCTDGVLVPTVIGVTDYAKLCGHVVGSTYAFLAWSDDPNTFIQSTGEYTYIPEPKRSAIVHCMLAHHGRKEWSSPVEPATNEAWILHAADMTSSREGA
jgi:hypothetical protein